MKNIVLIIFLFFSISSNCQTILPVDNESGKVTYKDVVSVDSVTAGDLYRRAKAWFAESYGSSKEVIQNDDPSTYTIQGKGIFKSTYTIAGSTYDWGRINYVITIACKDGRYKYIITNYYHDYPGYPSYAIGEVTNTMTCGLLRKKDVESIKEQVDIQSKLLVQSLYTGMHKTLISQKDW
jgi:hypothetical protein